MAANLDVERETRLIFDNMGLVVSIAKKFRPPNNAELEEYKQVGSIGLLKAIRSYKPESAKLSTWAYKHIVWEILRYIEGASKHKYVSLKGIVPTVEFAEDVILSCIPDYLSDEERQVILLRRENYSLAEISDIMKIDYYHIGKLFQAAIEKIRIANEQKTHTDG